MWYAKTLAEWIVYMCLCVCMFVHIYVHAHIYKYENSQIKIVLCTEIYKYINA